MSPYSLDRARLGDTLALRALLITLRPRLVRMAAFYARRCPADAEDLQQEAWIGVLEALPNLDIAIGNPHQRLLQYARWRMLDEVRRSVLRERPPEPDPASACDITCGRALDRLDTAAFLARLTPLQRRIARCLVDGFTWRETGARLGCTSANVAYHVRRIGLQYLEFVSHLRAQT